ncbi:uncharacterized protein LOC122500129 isoform X1 [Leptopilina heterotoma]|uniref:uncharacterized protein LOC122500129 isoform X1 n=1 Tax=Leptopilina heterotoma TaxID=63436 RepID=UPI001CA7CFCC|nr:uncharacterized protein LOC122500129 isoform X1 [Leptopilina heterotoma]
MDQDPTDVSDRSESNHSEVRAFQGYEKLKELNLTVDKNKDDTFKKDFMEGRSHSVRFDEFITDASELAMALNKPKDFNFLSDQIRYGVTRNSTGDEISELDNLSRNKELSNQKDVVFNIRQKNNSSLDRNNKEILMDREIKDFGILKNYNLERMKEFNLSFDRVRDNNLGIERLRGNSLMENPGILESSDYMNLQIQQRNPDLDALTYERMRRSHLLTTDLSTQSIATQRSRSVSQSQYQHQQQQVKSFTIDAILGLRNNQREKHQKGHHSYRKHQGQESSTKGSSSSSYSNGGGKLKRVRTIFTAEQLERLEGEFARQQYMVGPERLYLAHALRLTEAQVKVWFQNRRIKWRKLNHEQQSQRLHEFHQTSLTNLDQDDSNEASEWQK